MDITLTQGGTSVYFPVLPPSYKISSSQNNTTVNINATGEINLLGHKNLDTISWDCFFPSQNDDYVQNMQMSPTEYVETLKTMKEKGVCDLHLMDVLADHVTIESFDYSEEDGTGDIHYSISLKKYIYISQAGVVDVAVTKARPLPETPREGKTYTVKKGDTLWMIAKKQNGNSDWKSIYKANKSTIGDNPNKITEGMVLTLS